MIKKIHVLIAMYSLISHSVESVAAEPEGVKPRRILTLKEQVLTWQHYSDLPTVRGQKVADFLNFSDKINLQTIYQINSFIIKNRYKDKDSPFLKIQSALLFFFDGIRANNSAAFELYVSPKLSSSDSFFCLQHLYAQGLVSKKTVDDAEEKWDLSRKKSLAPYNQELVFEKALGFLWEGWQYYLFKVNSYFKRRLNIHINEIYTKVDIAEFRQELKGLADLGWPKAQAYVAEGLAEGCCGFTQDPIELKRLAELGWPEAQEYLAEGLAEGTHGFTQDPIELKRLAELGCPKAQTYVAEGLAEGTYGFTQDPIELKRLAVELGWTEQAQEYVARGLAGGAYGFTQDLIELKRLAELDWPNAEVYVAEWLAFSYEYLTGDPIELKRLAELGCPKAQTYVAEGLAEGRYGFTQDPEELIRLAKLDWTPAQDCVLEGVGSGKFGFKKNPAKLIRLARLGWTTAPVYLESYHYEFRGLNISPSVYQEALKLLEQTPKWVYSGDFPNKILDTIPSPIDKLAFALHMACLQQSRKG